MGSVESQFVKLPDNVLQQLAYGAPLASRWRRLGAVLIDGVIVLAVLFPIQFLRGVLPARSALPPHERLISLVLCFGIWMVLNAFLLSSYGQTIGKRVLRIQIVRVSRRSASLNRLAFLRYLPFAAGSCIPVVGPLLSLADQLLIFRSDRRCLHDLVAGTMVVESR